MTLGAVAEIRVADPLLLSIPVLHKIPNEAVKHRLRIWRQWDVLRWGVSSEKV